MLGRDGARLPGTIEFIFIIHRNFSIMTVSVAEPGRFWSALALKKNCWLRLKSLKSFNFSDTGRLVVSYDDFL